MQKALQKKKLMAKKRTASERQRVLVRLFGNTPQSLKVSFGVLSPFYWAFRRFHYWLCFYDIDVEIDVEDLLINPFNTQPPSLDDLEKLTGFRRDWIMFLYRNFKQICSNGRMSQTQWRQIFRLIFKGATDYEFADRIFNAISGNRLQHLITFENLIFCLFDLIQSFRNITPNQNQIGTEMENAIPSTTTAQFTFSLMQPDSRGFVDENAFLKYTKCIYDLNRSVISNKLLDDVTTFGMIQHMSGVSSNNGEKTSQNSSQNDFRLSKREKSTESITPWLASIASQKFKALDQDKDGFITLADIQQLFDQRSVYESLILHSEAEFLFNNLEKNYKQKINKKFNNDILINVK